jgi:phospholipase/carboxylesterase
MSLVTRERPAAGEAEGALVLFHGRGADENDLYPLLDLFDPERRLDGYTARGPLALPPGGAHWYALGGIGTPNPETFGPTFERAAGWLDSLGVAPERLVLGGFSQGAVMSYALGLTDGRPRPAAIVAMSGFLPTVPAYPLELAQPLPPIAIAHGTFDSVIGVEWGRDARERLEAAGAEVLYRESPIDHTIDPRFVTEVRDWLAQRVPA